MAVIEGGVSGALAGVGAEAAVPFHVTEKPIPYSTLGHYRISRRYALINAQAAGAVLVAFRNTSANPAIITRMRLHLIQTTAPTAAIEARISVTAALGGSYTVSDATNGTLLTLTGNNAKRRQSMGTAGVEIRETTVAAGATGGTKTLNTDAFGMLPLWLLLAMPTAGPAPTATYEVNEGGEGIHPLTFAQNEGFVIRNDAVLGAAAAGILYYEIDWAEVPSY